MDNKDIKIKELEETLDLYRKMMTKCDKSNKFPFGIQRKKYNPELLDDMDHLPYYIKKINEENKDLKKQLKILQKKFDLNIE